VLRHDKMLQLHTSALTTTAQCRATTPSTSQVPINEAPAAAAAAAATSAGAATGTEGIESAGSSSWVDIAMAYNNQDSWSTVTHQKEKQSTQGSTPVFL